MIRKIQSIHLYYFHAWSNKLNWCSKQNKEKHFKRPYLDLKFESLIQICSNPSGFSCISPTHSYCYVSRMHHIVAHCLVMVVYRCSLRQVLPPRSTVITLTKNRISASNHHKQPTIWSYRYNPMFLLLLSFTALRQHVSNCCVLW